MSHQSLLQQEHNYVDTKTLLCDAVLKLCWLRALCWLPPHIACELRFMQLSADEGLDLNQLGSDCLDGR